MITKNKVFAFVILVLIGVILFMYIFPPKPEPIDKSKWIEVGGKRYKELSRNIEYIDVPGETILVPDYIPVPGPTEYLPPIDVKIDTAAILKEFFAKQFYKDIRDLDTIGTVTISDVVSQNKIISRSLSFDYNLPVIRETIIVKENPVNKLYFGGGLNFDKTDFINSGYVGLLFQSKKDKIFGLNLGASTTDDGVKPYVGGALYWKIKLRKR